MSETETSASDSDTDETISTDDSNSFDSTQGQSNSVHRINCEML